MGRVERSALPSPSTYHVTSRGVARCEIYRDERDRRRFIALLGNIARRCDWRCPAYTLMSNHYHLLVETRIADLSAGMRMLNGTYAQRFNEKYARVGHLFEGRFSARVLRDDEHFENACAYIWNNPVRVGLCETAAEWPWNGSI
jgi:putative transposase